MTIPRFILLAAIILGGLMTNQSAAQPQTRPSDDSRIEKLLSQLTLDEKLSLLGGTGFETVGIPRLGIPPLNMTDGPVGVRFNQSSAFPVSIMMAATWNPELITKLGAALGEETKAKGRRMLLGPCVNIHRNPFGGRNFESFGEDPYLAARIAVAYVEGVQSEKVVATTKHFAANNQEFERDHTNVKVSERALREIYLPAFEAAVTEGGSMSVMSAYNKVNGAWCSENPHLLTEILKDEWKFNGFVVSDWGAVHSTAPTANAGLDVEMPTGEFMNPQTLLPLVKDGTVSMSVIDDKVRRLLRTIIWTGLMDGGSKDSGALNTPGHQALAREVAREGLVLMKNDGNLLPFDPSSVKSIAVIGPNAAVARTGGGGSSQVVPIYAVSPLDGIKSVFHGARIGYAKGCGIASEITPVPSSALFPPSGEPGQHGLKAEYFANSSLAGTPAVVRIDSAIDFDWGGGSPAAGIPSDNFSARWTGTLVAPTTGKYVLGMVSDDGSRLYLDGALVIDYWNDHGPATRSVVAELKAGEKHSISIEYYEHVGGASMRFGWERASEGLFSEAVELARSSDVAVLCLGLGSMFESEGMDRSTLELPADQVALLKAVSAVNKHTVVVLEVGSPVLMENWLGDVPALLQAWYPGEEGGNAIAEALAGLVNPSGRLPMTFLKKWEDSPAYGNFPGKDSVSYVEGIMVGYRHFDTKNIGVTFPFGHGLSYTTFEYKNAHVKPVKKLRPVDVEVTVELANTGTRTGAEVVELYIHPLKSSVERPEQELKGFQRVELKAGEHTTLTFHLNDRSFAHYDPTAKSWQVEPGPYEIRIGRSSRDTRVKATLQVD